MYVGNDVIVPGVDRVGRSCECGVGSGRAVIGGGGGDPPELPELKLPVRLEFRAADANNAGLLSEFAANDDIPAGSGNGEPGGKPASAF